MLNIILQLEKKQNNFIFFLFTLFQCHCINVYMLYIHVFLFRPLPEDGDVDSSCGLTDIRNSKWNKCIALIIYLYFPPLSLELHISWPACPDPPTTLDVGETMAQRKRRTLVAPDMSLSLDQSEGSVLSDEFLETPDDLDINVDDIETPDETDSLEFINNGNELQCP